MAMTEAREGGLLGSVLGQRRGCRAARIRHQAVEGCLPRPDLSSGLALDTERRSVRSDGVWPMHTRS